MKLNKNKKYKYDEKVLPKATLQDEELTIILKSLECFISKDIDEESFAQDLAMRLRKKAGWKGYYPPTAIEKLPSDLPQDRLKQYSNPAECKSGVCD